MDIRRKRKSTIGSPISSEKSIDSELENKKKQSLPRTFRREWLDIKAFQNWLILDDKKPQETYCKICKVKMKARLSILVRHSKSKDHCKACGYSEPPSAEDCKLPPKSERDLPRQIAEAKLILVGVCSKINLPFQHIPDLLEALQSVQNPGIWRDVKMGCTTAHDLTVNVIGKVAKDELAHTLKVYSFSICIKESITPAKEKCLAIFVKYIDNFTEKVKFKLWSIEPILKEGQTTTDSTQQLFECIRDSFSRFEIPLINIIACCFNDSQAINDEENSLQMKLQKEIPGIICLQHRVNGTHLCMKNALEKLPKDVTDLMIKLVTILKSSNKLHDFSFLQTDEISEHKISKILAQWSTLESFSKDLSEKGHYMGKKVFEMLNNVEIKCYFLLLQRVTEQLNGLDTFFENNRIVIPLAFDEIEKRLKNIISIIFKCKYILDTPIDEIDLSDDINYSSLFDIDLDNEIKSLLCLYGKDTENFCKTSYNFIISLSSQIQQSFQYCLNSVFKVTRCLNPENVMSTCFRDNNATIFLELTQYFHKLIGNVDTLINQWDNLINVDIPNELRNSSKIEEFWFFVLKFRDNNNIEAFVDLGNFVLSILTTPYMKIDKIFNTLNTRNKNKLKIKSVDGVLYAQDIVHSFKNGPFKPTEKMIKNVADGSFHETILKKKR